MEETLEYQVTHSIGLTPILSWLDKHFNTGDIEGSLLDLPETIAIQKGIVRKLRDTFQEADLPRKMLELEMIDDIAMEVNPNTGKALFSNDKLRDAELKRRKMDDAEYQGYQQQAKSAERELTAAEDELARLEQRFMAYGKVSEFVAAEMNLVAGILKVPVELKAGNDVPEIPRGSKDDGQPF